MSGRNSLILILLTASAFGQSWTTILPSSRAINWHNDGGLPTTFQYGTGGSACTGTGATGQNCVETGTDLATPPVRVQCGSTLSNPNVATVQADLINCPAGSYLKFTGTLTLASTNLNLFEANGGCTSPGNCPAAGLNGGGVTLRGAGPMQSTIVMTGSSVIGTGVSWSAPTCTVTAPSAGATSLAVASCSTNPVVGQEVFLTQCDTGWTGTCQTTGASVDNGAEFICGWDPICQNPANPPAPPHSEQSQNLLVTSITGGPCTTSCTLNVSPAVYATNWNASQGPKITWTGEVPGQNAPGILGIGLEDMTIDCTQGTPWTALSSNWCVDLNNCYGCWLKGVRLLGTGATGSGLGYRFGLRSVAINSYFVANMYDTGNNLTLSGGNSSNMLFQNNTFSYGDCSEEDGGNVSNIWGYNYCRDGSGVAGYFAVFFRHVAGQTRGLYEGNILENSDDDSIHGYGKLLNTIFRNYYSGADTAFFGGSGPFGIQEDQGTRFINIIGNIIADPTLTTYSGTGNNVVYRLQAGCCGGEALNGLSLMRWENCDSATGTCRNVAGENPSTLTNYTGTTLSLAGSGSGPYTGTISNIPILFGNEVIVAQSPATSGISWIGYDNSANGTLTCANCTSVTVNNSTGAVSATFSSTPPQAPVLNYVYSLGTASTFQGLASPSTSLPCSLYLTTGTTCTPKLSGGTGISWWKVATAWSSFPSTPTAFITTAFPPMGPDITGGTLASAGTGTAYDNPASVAWKHLPVDTTYQQTFTITSSVWSSTCSGIRGTYSCETLTVSGLPTNVQHLQGPFQLSGVNAACLPASGTSFTGRSDNEILISNSSSTTIVYALPINPGLSCTGSFKWPDVRQFDETIFTLDNGSSPSAPSKAIMVAKK